MAIEIIPVPVLKDNLAYLVHRVNSTEALVIDPSEPGPIVQKLESSGLRLRLILNTHHHHDHVGGNTALAQRFQAPVWCSVTDLDRVPCAERGLKDNEVLEFDGVRFATLAIPGHTQGQVAFHFADDRAVFVGDTLFAMGCGRLFEGTAAQLWSSLKRLMSLPEPTRIFFGHEYTERNARFALALDPDNQAIESRLRATLRALRERGVAPAPTLADELTVNPFLRPARLAKQVGLASASELEIFAELRRRRDDF